MKSKYRGTRLLDVAFSPDGKRIASRAFDIRLSCSTINIWDISRSLNAGNVLRRTFNRYLQERSRKIKVEDVMFEDSLKFSADGQYLLAGQSSFMLGDTHAKSEGEYVIGNSPHLYLNYHRAGHAWIFCGQQAIIKIPDSVPIKLDPYCVDTQNERIVIECIGRRLLILDIDVEILAETLDAATSGLS